jgi:hypothetical protein
MEQVLVARRNTKFIQASTPCKRGHIGLRYARLDSHGFYGACVECTKIRSQINNKKNHVRNAPLRAKWRKENKAYLTDFAKNYFNKYPERKMFYHARAQAKKKGLPFNLELSDISIPTRCPVLGIELRRGQRGRNDNSPSLDRVIPALGYVRGNILVVSWRANRLKNNASLLELEKIADFYRQLKL